jgi:hypothetical protein
MNDLMKWLVHQSHLLLRSHTESESRAIRREIELFTSAPLISQLCDPYGAEEARPKAALC